jgi:hypothetical protein
VLDLAAYLERSFKNSPKTDTKKPKPAAKKAAKKHAAKKAPAKKGRRSA